MSEMAIWARLDRPGHDAAQLRLRGAGWLLQGASVFAHEAGPAHVAYLVEVDAAWRTLRGSVSGFLGDRTFAHDIQREREGWRLDGALVEGLERLVDLDFDFTPATNVLHLRRAATPLGREVSVPVAWFDLDNASLTELPQTYKRRDEAAFWYEAPLFQYRGLLELAPNGFVKSYPNMWRLES